MAKHVTRKGLLAGFGGLLAAVGLGAGVLVAADGGSSAKAATEPLSTTLRGTCVKVGSGEYRDLWLTTSGKCPDGFWGPKSFGGSGGLTQTQIQAMIDTAVAKVAAGNGAVSKRTATVVFNADWAQNSKIKQISAISKGSAPLSVNAQGYLSDVFTFNDESCLFPQTKVCTGNDREYFGVLIEGLPKYSTSTRELWGSNVADSTMAAESDIQVEGVIQPGAGATTRTFVVSMKANAADDLTVKKEIKAFAYSRAFTLSAWVYTP